MNHHKPHSIWSTYFIKNPRNFWAAYVVLLIVLGVLAIWVFLIDGELLSLQGRTWFPLFLLLLHAVCSPLCFYLHKKEHGQQKHR